MKNTLLKWNLPNISRFRKIRRFREHEKFIIADFYEMDFMKRIVILVNVDEMYKILKSLLANRFWSRGKTRIQ